MKRKHHTRKFQRKDIERLRTCESVARLAEAGEELARPSTHEASFRKQAQQLKRLLAEKVLEVDFLKGALQKVEARRQSRSGYRKTASMTKFGK